MRRLAGFQSGEPLSNIGVIGQRAHHFIVTFFGAAINVVDLSVCAIKATLEGFEARTNFTDLWSKKILQNLPSIFDSAHEILRNRMVASSTV
jgi:hypothetical protein